MEGRSAVIITPIIVQAAITLILYLPLSPIT